MPAALSVDKTMTKAKQASKNKDWVTAQTLYQQVLDRFPSNKRARKAFADMRPQAVPDLLNAAKDAEIKEEWALARINLVAAFALAPDIREIAHALAECLLELAASEEALSVAEKYLAKTPSDIEFLNVKTRALHDLGRPEDARATAHQVLNIASDNAIALRNLGLIARSQGQSKEAAEYYAKSLKQRPKDVALHLQFANVHKYAADDPHIAQMRNALATLGKDNPAAALLYFALFEALHATKQHDQAFENLAKGNALLAKKYAYELRPAVTLAALGKSTFQDPLPEPQAPTGRRIIFVTGLPRSGTTLTERMLSMSPNVQACGELTFAEEATVARIRTIHDRADKRINADDIAALRADLLQRYADISDGREVQVDKMPLNFRWIGYLCAALPEARVVHMNRDPHAVGWSLFRQTFKRGGHDFIYSFEGIAGYMALHREIMKHWRQVCGSQLFDLNYSDLVANPKAATQSLATAVGLDWSPDWLSPEKAKTHVRTASAEQVTKPVYSGSDEGWKTYETQLAPLTRALSKAGLI